MTDTQQSNENEPDHIAALRERAEALPGAQAERDLLKLENSALRAGIDLSTRQGEGWALTYKGDWESPEDMKADYESYVGPTAQQAPAEATQEAPAAGAENFNSGMTEDLRKNQSGSAMPPGSTPPADPWTAAMEINKNLRESGAPPDAAQRGALAHIFEAAANGDERVIWTPEKHAEWMAQSS